MMRIGRTYRFAAAHFLPNHGGKCQQLHGHNYEVEVVLASSGLVPAGTSTGMVLDFWDLDLTMKPLLAEIDHRCLNELGHDQPDGDDEKWTSRFEPMRSNPTAENIALWFLRELRSPVRGVTVEGVKVWEERDCWAEAR